MTDNKRIVIAIDGYSSSGKSTMAKSLAAHIGYRYVDSGAMYRAVTLYAMRHHLIDETGKINECELINSLDKIKIDFDVTGSAQSTLLNGENVEAEIRALPVSNNVSAIAAIPAVRHHLVAIQKQYGEEGGIVMDGRDIGTTVFPDAQLKIFVNASPQTRAQRRLEELQRKGENVTYQQILANVLERDHIDETRTESPLRRADDAIDFDNSSMSIDQQNKYLIDLFNKTIND